MQNGIYFQLADWWDIHWHMPHSGFISCTKPFAFYMYFYFIGNRNSVYNAIQNNQQTEHWSIWRSVAAKQVWNSNILEKAWELTVMMHCLMRYPCRPFSYDIWSNQIKLNLQLNGINHQMRSFLFNYFSQNSKHGNRQFHWYRIWSLNFEYSFVW